MTRLNAKNSFGLLNLKNDKNTWINVICCILLIVLIVLLIVCLVKGKDSFGDVNDEDLIFMVTRQGCGFAAKAEKLIKDNNMKIGNKNVKFINMDDPKAKGVTGTPTFLSGDKKVVGFHPDLDELYKKLTEENNNNDKDDKDNNMGENVLLIGYMGCPFCKKAKNLLDNKGIKYKFIESNSDEGKLHMTKYRASGVPLVLHNTNGQIDAIHGFDEERLSKLK